MNSHPSLIKTLRIALLIRFFALVTGLLFTFGTLHSETIFSEDFTNTLPSGNMYLSDFGWSGYQGATAANLPTSLAFIPQNLGNPNTAKGYLAFTPSTTDTFAAVKTFSGRDVAGYELKWTMGNTQTTSTVRLLVKVGANWYASNEAFSNTSPYTATAFASTATGDVLRSLVFSITAANWRAFTLTPGSAMSLGATLSSDLPSSEITGIGFYVTAPGSSVVRLDSLAVTADGPLFFENFTNTLPSGNMSLSDFGWSGYQGATAATLPTSLASTPQNVGNPNTAKGYLVFSPSTADTFAAVKTFSGKDVADHVFRWRMGNTNATASTRLLVKVGSSWYASSKVFTNTSSYTAATFASTTTDDVVRSLDFSTAAASWRTFTLTPGSAMSLGAVLSSDLPSSEITGIGFYVTATGSATVRLDSLKVAVDGPVFSEKFTNTLPSGNMYLADFGWSGYQDANAATPSTSLSYIPQNVGNPNTAKGYLVFSPSTAGTFAAVKTFSGMDVAGSILMWNMGNSVPTADARLLVKVGSNWYASSEVFKNTAYYTAATFASNITEDVLRFLDFSTAAANWRAFTLTPGSAMSLGAGLSSNLPSSEITGIGFYATATGSAVVRLDSLEVTPFDPPYLPPGAAALGYTKCVIDEQPVAEDIAPQPNSTGNYKWFRGTCWSGTYPPEDRFTTTDGVLTILRTAEGGGSLVGTPHDFSEGALPTLPGEDGFYIEFDVRLSDNDSDHFPAVWLMPVQHNGGNGQPVADIYPGDPAGYERWMELDVDEGGFVSGSLSSIISWKGKWGGGTFFSEEFTNTLSSGNMYMADFSWSGYRDANAATLSTTHASIPQNLGNPNTPKGYLFLGPGAAGTFALVKSLPSLDVDGCKFTWSMGNTDTASTVRLLVKVGANWYASSEEFKNTSTYTADTFASTTTVDVRRSLVFSTAAANWRAFTLTPGTTMSLGAVLGSNLPSSQIKEIGFYVTTPAGSPVVRLDSLKVTMDGYKSAIYNSYNKAKDLVLDRTQVHTYGASYDPIESRVTWWLDGVQYFTADASHVPAIGAIQHFYPILSNQTHAKTGPGIPYSMYVSGVRAYVPPARERMVAGATLGTVSNAYTRWQGARITIGSSNITVTELGRMMALENTGLHTIKLVDGTTGQDIAGGSVSINLTYWRATQFKYGRLNKPVVLMAGQTYYVVCNETAGGNAWHDEQTQVTTTSAISAIRPIWGSGPGNWNMIDTPGKQFGPVDIKYLVAP